MEKEKVLEIETQEVFDKIAVRIKYLNDDFFAGGLLKEDVEKYNCSFIENPTDLEERIIWLYGDIYLSDNDIYCYCKETINKIKEFVDYVNKKYGITKRWRGKRSDNYFTILGDNEIAKATDNYFPEDQNRYNLGNYFRTEEEAQKVIDSQEWKDFWEKVRNGEIGNE
nr:MAG TPA: hypothetical protein [Caudoviricetes sp.]